MVGNATSLDCFNQSSLPLVEKYHVHISNQFIAESHLFTEPKENIDCFEYTITYSLCMISIPGLIKTVNWRLLF